MGKMKPWKRNPETPIGPEKGGVELLSTGPDKRRYYCRLLSTGPNKLRYQSRQKSRSKIEDKRNPDTLHSNAVEIKRTCKTRIRYKP